MQDLRVSLIQSMLHWEDAEANRRMFAERMAPLAGTTDLVVLPEMFTTGFTMHSRSLAEPMEGPTLDWMRAQAGMLRAGLYGSIVVEEGGRHFNRGLFVLPDGSVDHYDKRHLFRMAGEHDHYAPGVERRVVEWRGWRILLQVCYDLRFPVFSRNRNDYDLALYVANWPAARSRPWSQLLIARAIENLAFVAGVNCVGMDGKGIHYTGDSAVVDFKGDHLAQCTPGREEVVTVTLDRAALNGFRERFPAHLDADPFSLDL